MSVHRLVQEVSRFHQRDDPARALLAESLGWIDPEDVRDWPVLEPLAPHAKTVALHADAAGITEPTSRLLNQVGVLLLTKAQHAEAEPLMCWALAIDEQSSGTEHPEVATALNNLTPLLQATKRLAEAKPLMRRMVEIFLLFTQRSGHEHPHLQAAKENYRGLLAAMGRDEAEQDATVDTLVESVRQRGKRQAAAAIGPVLRGPRVLAIFC